MKNLRILHVLTQRPDGTGSGVTLQALIGEARERGLSSRVVVGIPWGEESRCRKTLPAPCHPVLFEGRDVAGAVVGMSDVMPYRSRSFRDLLPGELERYERAFSLRVREAVAAYRPHLIHLHHLWIGAAVVAEAFPGLPLLAHCHGSDLRQFRNGPALAGRVRPALARLDAVAALNDVQAREVVDLYGIPTEVVHVVGAGFDRSLFRPSRKEVPPPVEILYAGKLSRAKGVPWLLTSLERVVDLPWRLHLAGEGSGDEGALCRRLGLPFGGRVLFHGALPQKELAELMGRVHLFVLPSLFEGLPLVFLQALASGCRVVSTALPGLPRELVASAGGALRLVPLPRLAGTDSPRADDEERFRTDLAEALAETTRLCLREGPPREMAALEAFTWPAVFDRVETLYRRILAGRKPPFLYKHFRTS